MNSLTLNQTLKSTLDPDWGTPEHQPQKRKGRKKSLSTFVLTLQAASGLQSYNSFLPPNTTSRSYQRQHPVLLFPLGFGCPNQPVSTGVVVCMEPQAPVAIWLLWAPQWQRGSMWTTWLLQSSPMALCVSLPKLWLVKTSLHLETPVTDGRHCLGLTLPESCILPAPWGQLPRQSFQGSKSLYCREMIP